MSVIQTDSICFLTNSNIARSTWLWLNRQVLDPRVCWNESRILKFRRLLAIPCFLDDIFHNECPIIPYSNAYTVLFFSQQAYECSFFFSTLPRIEIFHFVPHRRSREN